MRKKINNHITDVCWFVWFLRLWGSNNSITVVLICLCFQHRSWSGKSKPGFVRGKVGTEWTRDILLAPGWSLDASLACFTTRFVACNSNFATICFAVTWNILFWSWQNFAHVTTAVLLWHVQNFIMIRLVVFDGEQDIFFKIWVMSGNKIDSETGAWTVPLM